MYEIEKKLEEIEARVKALAEAVGLELPEQE